MYFSCDRCKEGIFPVTGVWKLFFFRQVVGKVYFFKYFCCSNESGLGLPKKIVNVIV